MFLQTLSAALTAAALMPTALGQTAAAPQAVVPADPYETCQEKLGPGGSHALIDILNGAFVTIGNGGEDTVLAPLLEALSAETLEILEEFDVTGTNSYTLIMPENTDKFGNKLADTYDLNSTTILAKADDIIQAHILPGTIGFEDLSEETNSTGKYTVASLQGFEWTFELTEDGFLALADEYNITTEGFLEIQTDLRNEPACPNRIIGVDGFLVTPDLLPEAPAPAPVPTRSLPPPPPPATPAPTPPPSPPPAEDDPSGAGTFTSSGLAALSAIGAAALGAALL